MAHIPPEEYYKNLPKKRVASGILFFNTDGKFLIVKPSYKKCWEIPGGAVELDESPFQGLKREVEEELGWELNNAELIHVEYQSNVDGKGDRFHFVFDGGIVDDYKISTIKLDKEELLEYRFVDFEEMRNFLCDRVRDRLLIFKEAKNIGKFKYLELL
jgi:8-oxo-dGTP pyrophosphatase MutT (NUDIX family)